MRHSMTRAGLAAALAALAVAGLAAPVSAHEPAARLPPQAASDCSGDIPVVVASDAAAQSDMYSAVTLAGALGTDCVVLAGPRDGAFPADQLRRLEDATPGGWLVGGEAAVPAAKVRGRDLTRIAGADRWETAALVGDAVRQLTSSGSTQPATSISGSGDAVKFVTLTAGRWLIEASVTGNDSDILVGLNFIVILTSPNGDRCELVANDIGAELRNSAVAHISSNSPQACPPGEFAVEITAAGDWTIAFTKR